MHFFGYFIWQATHAKNMPHGRHIEFSLPSCACVCIYQSGLLLVDAR